MMVKPKSCQVCHTPAKVLESYAGFDVFCPCYKCHPKNWVFAKTEEEAIELWNKIYGEKS